MGFDIWSKIFLIQCFFTITLYAQSARIEALGGNFCIDDASSVSSSPTSSLTHNDIVQATAYQDGTFGPVFGVKSIGKYFTLGFTANKEADVNSIFYDDACEFLDAVLDTNSYLPERIPPYPHVITALKLPFMTIGGEIIYDRVYNSVVNVDGGTTNLSANKEVSHLGFYLSSGVDLGNIGIYPFIGYVIPYMSGAAVSDTSGTRVTTSITNNKSLKGGAELGIYIGELAIALGGGAFDETYSFVCDTFQHNQPYQYHSMVLNGYCAVTAYPSLTVQLSTVYAFSYSIFESKIVNSDFIRIHEKYIENSHQLIGSCEISHDISTLSMDLFLRAGVSLTALAGIWLYNEEEDGSVYTEKDVSPLLISQFEPSIGFGVKKGIVQFDVASKLAGWSGIVSGLPVVTGTLTIDFKALDRNIVAWQ